MKVYAFFRPWGGLGLLGLGFLGLGLLGLGFLGLGFLGLGFLGLGFLGLGFLDSRFKWVLGFRVWGLGINYRILKIYLQRHLMLASHYPPPPCDRSISVLVLGEPLNNGAKNAVEHLFGTIKNYLKSVAGMD